MADGPIPVSWLQTGGALTAVLAAFGAAFRWVNMRFQRAEDRLEAHVEKLRSERHDGDMRLWLAINAANAESARHRAAVATREELLRMFRDHESRMEKSFDRMLRSGRNQEGD